MGRTHIVWARTHAHTHTHTHTHSSSHFGTLPKLEGSKGPWRARESVCPKVVGRSLLCTLYLLSLSHLPHTHARMQTHTHTQK